MHGGTSIPLTTDPENRGSAPCLVAGRFIVRLFSSRSRRTKEFLCLLRALLLAQFFKVVPIGLALRTSDQVGVGGTQFVIVVTF